MLRPGSELPLAVGLARNAFVHGRKPSLAHLQCVGEVALPFIKTAYWQDIPFPTEASSFTYRDFIEESIPTKNSLTQVAHRLYGSYHDGMASGHRVLYELPCENHP